MSFATSILVGSTSSAAMLPDTSKVSKTVPSMRGSGKVSCGRAEATAKSAMPTRKIKDGMWRRFPMMGVDPSRTMPRVPRPAASLLRFCCKRT